MKRKDNKNRLNLLISIRIAVFTMHLRTLFFLINTILVVFRVNAQENNIPIGDWRVHLPYTINKSIEIANNKIYVANEINGFSYDLTTKNIEILSKINILTDVNISKIRYNSKNDALVFGYTNGNIDILKGSSTTNINGIKRKNITTSKNINDISFRGDFAYVCCDFGVCVVDLKKFEIKEAYENLAPSGQTNKVYGCTFSSDEDSIFLATDRGVMAAKNSQGANLMDYNSWFTFGSANGIPSIKIKNIVTFNKVVYTATSDNKIYYNVSNTWIQSSLPTDGFASMRISQDKLVVSCNNKIIVASSDTKYDTQFPNLNNVFDTVIDKDGFVWVGDLYGLYTNRNSNSYYLIQPNGLRDYKISKISSYENSILVTIGAYKSNNSPNYYPPEYYIFNNYEWSTKRGPTPLSYDLVNGVYNPIDKKTYFSSAGFGLLIANPDNTYELINDTTGPFPRYGPDKGPYVRVFYTEVDKKGNVWVSTLTGKSSDPSLHVRYPNGLWGKSKSFYTPASQFPIEILIDDNDFKWIRLKPNQGGGVIVYDDKTDKFRILSDQVGYGSLPDVNVTAMAKDRNGDIWLATTKGIVIFYNSKTIVSNGEGFSPIFDGYKLMYNETVNCIAVDGGNRKWIGTKNGVWLLNDDGTEIINYFTQDNSPLLSNNIVDIEINNKTGEVFIGTDKGLISYRGMSTGSSKKFGDIKVFPNPITNNYNGLISISNLSTDANVKITDIFGTLIYQTTAEGGTAIWNGKNYNGKRAEPGVYLIFSASSDGEEKMVGKIAVE